MASLPILIGIVSVTGEGFILLLISAEDQPCTLIIDLLLIPLIHHNPVWVVPCVNRVISIKDAMVRAMTNLYASSCIPHPRDMSISGKVVAKL